MAEKKTVLYVILSQCQLTLLKELKNKKDNRF